jgi:hypothetical protein
MHEQRKRKRGKGFPRMLKYDGQAAGKSADEAVTQDPATHGAYGMGAWVPSSSIGILEEASRDADGAQNSDGHD